MQGEAERPPRRVKRIEEKDETRSKASLDREVSIPIDLRCKAPARDTAQPLHVKRETKSASGGALKPSQAIKCADAPQHRNCPAA